MVSFEAEEYTVSEGDGTADVCVVWTGDPPMDDIVVQVETTPCDDSGECWCWLPRQHNSYNDKTTTMLIPHHMTEKGYYNDHVVYLEEYYT